MRLLKLIYVAGGTLSVGLGVLGIFVPGLPTTVFLLIAAYLYMRSSEKMYKWLISNRLLGKYILDFHQKKGMTLPTKIYAISLMWLMISLSVIFFIPNPIIDYVVLGVGIIGTISMGFLVRTVKSDNADKS
ncbi:MAG: YbaN family protein [Bacteroidales bacterium]|nr:YbaN family protein [Bacteroidales bacterium]